MWLTIGATYCYKPQRAILIIAFQKISRLVFRNSEKDQFYWIACLLYHIFFVFSTRYTYPFRSFLWNLLFVYCGAIIDIYIIPKRPWQTSDSELTYRRQSSPEMFFIVSGENTGSPRNFCFVGYSFLTTVYPTLTHGVHGNSGHERSGDGLKIIITH